MDKELIIFLFKALVNVLIDGGVLRASATTTGSCIGARCVKASRLYFGELADDLVIH